MSSKFNSPLLASLRRPGADDPAQSTSNRTDDDVWLRQMSFGGAERPLFGTSARPAHPSPLAPRTANASPLPSQTPSTAAAATPPTSIGTSFKARLLAMQQRAPASSSMAGPPLSQLSRARPFAATGAGGAAPPVATLEHALHELQLNEEAVAAAEAAAASQHEAAALVEEVEKMGMGSPVTPAAAKKQQRQLQGAANTLQSPSSKTLASPLDATHPHPRAFSTTATPTTHWSPIVGSASRGQKARGAGALGAGTLCVSRFAPPQQQPTTQEAVPSVATFMPPSAAAAAASLRPKSPVKFKSSGVDDARSLQLRLATAMPEFGVRAWAPPPPPEKGRAVEQERGSGSGSSRPFAGANAAALRELAALRGQVAGKVGETLDWERLKGAAEEGGERIVVEKGVGPAAAEAVRREPSREVAERLAALSMLRQQAAQVVVVQK